VSQIKKQSNHLIYSNSVVKWIAIIHLIIYCGWQCILWYKKISGRFAPRRSQPVKRKSSFHNKMLQFRYEHKNFDNTFSRLRKSAEEVNKTLNKMSQNDEKKEK